MKKTKRGPFYETPCKCQVLHTCRGSEQLVLIITKGLLFEVQW